MYVITIKERESVMVLKALVAIVKFMFFVLEVLHNYKVESLLSSFQ